MGKRNIIILGAAGRDFHNFNTFFRGKPAYNVVAFTATQIPNIEGRRYPASLAGEALYSKGIPIYGEAELPKLIEDLKVDDCVFSYSDVSYTHVMSLASIVQDAGANFMLMGTKDTMIQSNKPVISVSAVRTGCGKSQTSRKVIETLINKGLKVVAIRHPMPYGDLEKQKVQRFAGMKDLDKHQCTIEEREEYEPHIERGNVIYAGIDYEAILKEAENDPDGCDIILWDGGNNDFPFYQPDLNITVTDPHRAGDELRYFSGEVNLRMADLLIINKIDSAHPDDVQTIRNNISRVNPTATVIDAASPLRIDDPSLIKGKRVLAVEDGPTLTHGGMKLGAATVAAKKYGASEIIDPRPYTVGKLTDTFLQYPNIGALLPAMGYSDEQIQDLEKTINQTDCDAVIIGTPIDLNRMMHIQKPNTRVYYELQEIGKPDLNDLLEDFISRLKIKK